MSLWVYGLFRHRVKFSEAAWRAAGVRDRQEEGKGNSAGTEKRNEMTSVLNYRSESRQRSMDAKDNGKDSNIQSLETHAGQDVMAKFGSLEPLPSDPEYETTHDSGSGASGQGYMRSPLGSSNNHHHHHHLFVNVLVSALRRRLTHLKPVNHCSLVRALGGILASLEGDGKMQLPGSCQELLLATARESAHLVISQCREMRPQHMSVLLYSLSQMHIYDTQVTPRMCWVSTHTCPLLPLDEYVHMVWNCMDHFT